MAGMRVDLDAAEYEARHHFHAKWVQPTVLALVAELRAAREVIDAVMDDTNDVSMRVDVALDGYEKAVTS
jgi:hypothetical protein